MRIERIYLDEIQSVMICIMKRIGNITEFPGTISEWFFLCYLSNNSLNFAKILASMSSDLLKNFQWFRIENFYSEK